MPTTILALYDRIEDAQGAVDALTRAGVDRGRVRLITGQAGGIEGALAELAVPESDARHYRDGVARGGTIVLARAEEADAAMIRDILERRAAAGSAGRGADWGTVGQAPFDERPGPMAEPVPDRESSTRSAARAIGEAGRRSRTGEVSADATEVGQPAGSPGGRGGATAYGGVIREPARAAGKPPPEKR